jgi:DNA primase
MDSQVQEIKDRVDIAEVVGQYAKLERTGKNLRARCPFHNERTPSFYVSPERGTYMCFGCGEKGDAFSFLQKMEGIDFPTALKQLAEKAGVTLTIRGPVQSKDERDGAAHKVERLRAACEAATSFFESVLNKRVDVREYLQSRGVKDETRTLWRLGYASPSWHELSVHLVSLGFSHDELIDAGLAVKSQKRPNEIFDRFRGRIMFPLFDAGGQVIAFSGRFFEDLPSTNSSSEYSEPAKYVNSPETLLFKKSRILYGFDRAKAAIRKADCILLVEGQFDLVLAHQSGLPFTVALSGTALTPEHLVLLGRLSKRLVLALDADAAGVRAGLKSALMAYSSGFDVKIPQLPLGKDPADLAREDPELLRSAVRSSKTAIEFFMDILQQPVRAGASAPDERTYQKLIEARVLPLVAVLGSRLEQAHFVGMLVRRLRAPESAVWAELAKRPILPKESIAADESISSGALEQEELSPFKWRVGMLLFSFSADSDIRKQLETLLGPDQLRTLEMELSPRSEELQYRFEREVGEHSAPNIIAADLLERLGARSPRSVSK